MHAGNEALPHVSIDPMNDVVCLPYSRYVWMVSASIRSVLAAIELTACAHCSGTTGLPKGVCLTHFNLISNFLQMSDIDPPDDDDGALPPAFTCVLCCCPHVRLCVASL
jgi:acyl-CoA synthetase (AMP-forming)/AMP-acid ligase II